MIAKNRKLFDVFLVLAGVSIVSGGTTLILLKIIAFLPSIH
jgi:hypothetical protein